MSSSALAEVESFPIEIKGKTVNIQVGATRTEIAGTLKKIFAGEEPSVASAERLQYDYIAKEGEGPLALMFDFNKAGVLVGLGIDANMKQQNPVAVKLLDWLKQNGGASKKQGKFTRWEKSGYVFKFKEVKAAGDDSYYGFEISKK
jgi:hypothetical protein